MKPILLVTTTIATYATAITLLCAATLAADPTPNPAVATPEQTNTTCPITGKPVDPAITLDYEGRKWSFAADACRTQFQQAREKSLYQRLGGQAAINAAVDAFYVKVLADDRVKHFFADINMASQHRKQKEFLSAALGSPVPWTGKDMRTAHEDLDLKEEHFNAIAENLIATLKDLGIAQPLIDETIAIVATTKDAILNRPKAN